MDDNRIAKSDFYQRLRRRIRRRVEGPGARKSRWAEYLLFAPDLLHLLCRLAVDPEVPAAERAKLALAVAYFVSPLDLVPEGLLGAVGYLDDVALAAYVLNGLVNRTSPEVVRRHWAGEVDVLVLIQRILMTADTMLGRGVWKRLRRLGKR